MPTNARPDSLLLAQMSTTKDQIQVQLALAEETDGTWL